MITITVTSNSQIIAGDNGSSIITAGALNFSNTSNINPVIINLSVITPTSNVNDMVDNYINSSNSIETLINNYLSNNDTMDGGNF